MCVLAESSFGLAAVLVPVGAYCIKAASQRDVSFLPLSAVPLPFGVQQICEGLVWVGNDRDDGELTRMAALLFPFFALGFWLFWIPFSAMCFEERKAVRRLLAVVLEAAATGRGFLSSMKSVFTPRIECSSACGTRDRGASRVK